MAFSRSLVAADTVVLLPAIAFSFLLITIPDIQGAGCRSGCCRPSSPPCVPPLTVRTTNPIRGGKLPVALVYHGKGHNTPMMVLRFRFPTFYSLAGSGKR